MRRPQPPLDDQLGLQTRRPAETRDPGPDGLAVFVLSIIFLEK